MVVVSPLRRLVSTKRLVSSDSSRTGSHGTDIPVGGDVGALGPQRDTIPAAARDGVVAALDIVVAGNADLAAGDGHGAGQIAVQEVALVRIGAEADVIAVPHDASVTVGRHGVAAVVDLLPVAEAVAIRVVDVRVRTVDLHLVVVEEPVAVPVRPLGGPRQMRRQQSTEQSAGQGAQGGTATTLAGDGGGPAIEGPWIHGSAPSGIQGNVTMVSDKTINP